ncbi:MAG: arylamine N-acetyltransferase [Cyclobacteriaceae bacterium]
MELNHFKTRPKVAAIDTATYLNKLGLFKELPSLNYLRQLHRQHQMVIPFENLDVHFRRPITPDVRKIFNKIIPTKRGGFCYELNLLFYHLLVHLGYECQLISANVFNKETKEFGPEYDHMAILVKIQDSIYLCDVGFGDGFIYPKKLDLHSLQMDFNRYFKFFIDPDDNYFIKRTLDTQNFEPLYRFKIQMREPIEFLDQINFKQSSPESPFVGKKIITMLTPEGRITLSDGKLRIQERGEDIHIAVLNDDDFFTKMEEHFDISYQTLLQV